MFKTQLSKTSSLLVAWALIVLFLPTTASALCPQCATWYGQLQQKVELVISRIAQLKQLETQIVDTRVAIQNGTPLDNYAADGSPLGLVLKTHQLVVQTDLAIQDVQDISKSIDDEYANYKDLLGGKKTYTDIYKRYAKRNKKQAKKNYKLAFLYKKQITKADEEETAKKLAEQVSTAEGQQQALQATAAIIQDQTEYLKKLVALQIAQLEGLAAANGDDSEAKLALAAAREQLNSLNHDNTRTPGGFHAGCLLNCNDGD